MDQKIRADASDSIEVGNAYLGMLDQALDATQKKKFLERAEGEYLKAIALLAGHSDSLSVRAYRGLGFAKRLLCHDPKEILVVQRQTVELSRQLERERGGIAFLSDLVKDLARESITHEEMGFEEEARECAQEVVDGYKELVDRDPEQFLVGSAASCVRLGELWQKAKQALEANEQFLMASIRLQRLSKDFPTERDQLSCKIEGCLVAVLIELKKTSV
ncbi:MAG: hypothetical protein AAB444_02550 [Patescibacteria group bacterium]|mgnify:CR=1 FL=1